MHPVWQQKKLIEFCKAKQILVAAYSPLGSKGTSWGTNSVMDSQVLKQIAEAKGKTTAQVLHFIISIYILLNQYVLNKFIPT